MVHNELMDTLVVVHPFWDGADDVQFEVEVLKLTLQLERPQELFDLLLELVFSRS